jgi:thymidylate synthase
VHHFVSSDLAEDYWIVLRKVMEEGQEVAPRGKPTREILAFTLELTDPTRALVRGTGRRVHVGLAAAEALQLVGGFSDPGALLKVSEHFGQFMDGGVFHAPYGPRIATQVPEALAWLGRDPDSRKAHVVAWDPLTDLWTHDTRDHPCTTHLQFMIRDGALNLHVGMRANDAWRGFPYDVFQFTQLQQAAASLLGVPLGTYYHHATSFHLYEENYEAVQDVESSSQEPVGGVATGCSPSTWAAVQVRARALFYGLPPADCADDLGPGERLMWNALRKAGVEGAW